MLLIERMMLRQAQHDKKEMPDSAKADKQVRHDKTSEVQEVRHSSTWKFRKIIAFADEEAASSFSGGESWYAKLKDYFGIEIIAVKISPAHRKKLLKAQERQYR